jgi:hypothetical protein
MINQFASAKLAWVFAAVLLVAGQLYIEKSSVRTGRAFAGTLSMPAR